MICFKQVIRLSCQVLFRLFASSGWGPSNGYWDAQKLGVLNDKLGNQKQYIKYFNPCLYNLTKGGNTSSNCGMIFDITQKLAEPFSKENNYDKALELCSQLIVVLS